jgi:hypothetical protein
MMQRVLTFILAASILAATPSNAALIQKTEVLAEKYPPVCYHASWNYVRPTFLFSGPSIRFRSGKFTGRAFQQPSQNVSWAQRTKHTSRYFMGRVCIFEQYSLD